MAKTVYWAPWGPPQKYSESFLGYTDPVNVFTDTMRFTNKENKLDNFFSCPAFVNSVKNTFLFKSPANCDVEFKEEFIINRASPNIIYDRDVLVFKNPSMLDSYTIRFAANWIFFSDDDLDIESRHPYLHQTQVSKYGYYVPGTMNIGAWFRPLEYAFQCWPGVNEFKVDQEDPLMYLKVNTNDPVIFKKFYLTPELFDLSMSCVRLKNYWRERNLKRLYNIFNASKIRNKILNEIKKNIMD
jgi:hypothetical protein